MHHVRRFLYQSGGVRLAPQQRSERHLTGNEREEISPGIAAGESARAMRRSDVSSHPTDTGPSNTNPMIVLWVGGPRGVSVG